MFYGEFRWKGCFVSNYAISIDLPVGTYHVKEIDPPTGFILSDEATEITISTDNKSTAVLERANKANEMTLKKSDITNGMPVPDATITIYDACKFNDCPKELNISCVCNDVWSLLVIVNLTSPKSILKNLCISFGCVLQHKRIG